MTASPHHVIGYWGFDDARSLEQTLAEILGSFDCSAQGTRSPVSVDSAGSVGWNAGYIGVSQVPPAASGSMLAAISAAGIPTFQQEDGTLSPDAWVRVADDRLILGREPFGRVPLYWTIVGKTLWFATQMQLLRAIVPNPEISIPALYGYSCFSYVPTPLTPIAQIMAVPAGVELVWQTNSAEVGQPQTRRVLEWQEATEPLEDEATAIGQLQTLLKASIERQTRDLGGAPVGVLLSGGLDSSIVAALLVQAGCNVRAYSLDFGDAGTSEYSYAEQVAHWLKIPLVRVDASADRVRRAIGATTKALDLPFGDGVTVPLYLLAEAARQDTSVIFNGENGDQLFAGWTNKPLIAASVYGLHHPAGEEPFLQQYLRTFHRLWGYEAQVFQPQAYAQIQAIAAQDWIGEALNPAFTTSLLHRLRRATLMLKGAQNIQPRATNLAFAHGLWVRSPFCDRALAEWSFRLSGELSLRGACEKYILKKAVEDWLPPEIVWRSKRGMGVPLTSWCFNRLWHSLGEWLNPAVLQREGCWQPDLAARIVSGELGAGIQGRRIGETLWLLLMWQQWRLQVLGESAGHRSWDHPFWQPRWLWRFQRSRRKWE